MREKLAIVLMSIGIIAFGVLSVLNRLATDRTAPVFKISEDKITYVEGTDKSTLLEGVEANDNKDGYLTNVIRVDSVVPSDSKKTAVVVYAVYDSSNNVAKAKRTVYYVPADGSANNGAEDANAEGDETADGQQGSNQAGDANSADNGTSDDTADADNAGDDDADTDSDNDAADNGSEAPKLTMAVHEFAIAPGGPFTAKNRVASVSDDKDDSNYLMAHLTVSGEYDINTIGVYELTYYVTDSDNNKSNSEKMTLTVTPNPPANQ